MTAQVVPPAVGLEWVNAMADRRRRPPVLATRDLGLRYDVHLQRDRSIGHAIRDLVRRRDRDRFWALRHVDLTVRAGDCVAVIGPNGAGKSTLLQVIAQLIEPDEGQVLTKGRVSALLNLGVGFDPRLTGRENIELLGALMGLRGAEVRERMPELVAFADLGAFIDAPLRTYSSGMRARLGFAAATMIDPNILVLDEVLGTGDVTFRERSRSRVMELIEQARAVVTATHDMTWVADFATYAVLLERGRIIGEGAPSAVTAFYRARSARPQREYACPGCQTADFEGYCPTCGLMRRERDPGEGGVRAANALPIAANLPQFGEVQSDPDARAG